MRNASGQQGENERQWKIKANMNTGGKTLDKHIRQFLHRNNVTRKFHVLVVQNSVLVVQNNGKGETKKRAARANLFLLIRRKSVLHVQFVYLLITSISLEAICIVVPV